VRRAERDRAFEEFVVARRSHLRRIGYALCGSWDRAEDLVQVALEKAYVAWPRIDRPDAAEAYVRTIMVRANIDESRRPWRREHPSAELPDTAVPARDAEVDDRSALFAALQELPKMQRAVVLLRHWLDLPVAQVAAELGISEGTVKSHASRGLATLRGVLGVDLGLVAGPQPGSGTVLLPMRASNRSS
jgi:RNA polymerase sigma-70 factor (sigma-E family)